MTGGEKQPYFRFFASDWLGGTRGMRATEVGIYITLIALMYDRAQPLIEDPKRLARQCGCTPKTFIEVLETLVEDEKIIRLDDGLWNKRVEKEFKWREKSSTTAREAAQKRWGKPNEINDADMPAQCDSNADAMLFQNPEAIEVSNARTVDDEFREVFWPKYPHKVGKAAALPAFRKARKKASLVEIMDGLERYIAAKPPDRSWCNPATFLNQERWADEPSPEDGRQTGLLLGQQPKSRMNGSGAIIAYGTDQWDAWKADHVRNNSSKQYEYRDEPGLTVREPTLWPSRR